MEKSIEVIFVFIKNMNGSERFVNDWISNGLGHFSSLHPNISMHILHTVLYTFSKVLDKENLFNNQELLQLVIISFILSILSCDSVVISYGEIRC